MNSIIWGGKSPSIIVSTLCTFFFLSALFTIIHVIWVIKPKAPPEAKNIAPTLLISMVQYNADIKHIPVIIYNVDPMVVKSFEHKIKFRWQLDDDDDDDADDDDDDDDNELEDLICCENAWYPCPKASKRPPNNKNIPESTALTS